MNRRNAIKALTAIPGIATVSSAPVRPNDVIVIECERSISDDTAARIKAMAAEVWPGQRVVVMSDGMKLKIVEGK